MEVNKTSVSKKQTSNIINIIIVLIILSIIVVVLSYTIADFIIAPSRITKPETKQINSTQDPIIGTWSCKISDLAGSRTLYFLFLDNGNCYFSYDLNNLVEHSDIWKTIDSSYIIYFNDNPFNQDTPYMIIANYEVDGSLTINIISTINAQSYILKRILKMLNSYRF